MWKTSASSGQNEKYIILFNCYVCSWSIGGQTYSEVSNFIQISAMGTCLSCFLVGVSFCLQVYFKTEYFFDLSFFVNKISKCSWSEKGLCMLCVGPPEVERYRSYFRVHWHIGKKNRVIERQYFPSLWRNVNKFSPCFSFTMLTYGWNYMSSNMD